jgi:hypothetical protein
MTGEASMTFESNGWKEEITAYYGTQRFFSPCQTNTEILVMM